MDSKWIKYRFINEFIIKKNVVRMLFLKKGFDVQTINKYARRKILDINKTNDLIANLIRTERPFMVGRFGGSEMNAIVSYLQINHFPYIDKRKKAICQLCKLSGFFPEDVKLGKKFVDLMLHASACIDLCAIWNLYMEDYVLETYAPRAKLTILDYLEPWRMDNGKTKPWTSALKGKKVLVVHPFAETISQQYNSYRTKIFERKFVAEDILPDFELITMKAVQTLNYNTKDIPFRDWFEALESMIEQCKKIDFDVAIVGCGAYGFPLAAAIKEMGKGAIHLGGATQILFGIIGKRWESGSYKVMMNEMQNDCWTRPLSTEKLPNADEIEGGCYW